MEDSAFKRGGMDIHYLEKKLKLWFLYFH
jgi:hypothetical protein